MTVTDDQVLTYSIPGANINPELVIVGAMDAEGVSRHPLAGMVRSLGLPPVWFKARRLEPSSGGDRRYQVEEVLGSEGVTWTETDMKRNAATARELLRRGDPDLVRRRSGKQRAVALAVSEPAGPDKPPVPRLIVFGCSTCATNQHQTPPGNNANFDIIRGSIDWCRERSANVGIAPKSHRYFSPPQQASAWNLLYLPVAVMVFGVGALGLIVWNIRRS